MARYKGDHWDKTHAAVIDAAGKMLRQRGFDDTSVVEVMKAVGLTHGGFYAHFDDKTDMLVAALGHAFVGSPKNFATLAKIANAKGDAGLIAEKYLANERLTNPATGCPAAALVSELPRQPEAVQMAFKTLVGPLAARWRVDPDAGDARRSGAGDGAAADG
jgi:TetR/AcrR family transcriptional regulator, transcriptional repressor for nem operon